MQKVPILSYIFSQQTPAADLLYGLESQKPKNLGKFLCILMINFPTLHSHLMAVGQP